MQQWEQRENDQRITDLAKQKTVFYSTADGLDWKTVSSAGQVIEKTYSLDGRRELLSLSDPDAGTTTNVYDGMGRVISSTAPHGSGTATTTLHYDQLGRVTQTTTTHGTATWQWDTVYATAKTAAPEQPGNWKGAVISTTGYAQADEDPSDTNPVLLSTQSTLYDEYGRAVSSTQTLGAETWTATTSFGTDQSDLLRYGKAVSSTDAGGLTTVAGYNNLGFAQATTTLNGSLLHRIDAVDVFGNTVKETLGNGVTSRTEHDRSTGKLLGMTAHKGNTLLQKNTYVSDNFGNIDSLAPHARLALAGSSFLAV